MGSGQDAPGQQRQRLADVGGRETDSAALTGIHVRGVLAAVAVYLLSLAMRTLPVGTAYAVFTGIGAVGAITLGLLVQKDPVTLGLIVTGVLLARLTNPE